MQNGKTWAGDLRNNLNKEQEDVFEAMKEGKNMFITGQAGVGKTFLIKKYKKWCDKNGRTMAVTSTTGISALLAGGKTIHSWAGIGLGDLEPSDLLSKVRKKSYARKNWKETDCLVMDEVSMLTPDLLEKLEYIARAIRWSDEIFGAMQVILIGDFCQLPPVKSDVYAFKSELWNTIIQGNEFYLRTNMRQNDPIFQNMLSRLRMGIKTEEDRKLLLSRLNAEVSVIVDEIPIKPTKLHSHRKIVEDMNIEELKLLQSENNKIKRFNSVDKVASTANRKLNKKTAIEFIERLNKNSQARACVDLCVGAQVMLIYNIEPKSGLVNGSRGVVVGFGEQRPIVRFMNGIVTIVKAMEWEFIINETITVVRKQIPLILAWGVTIHKVQGASLDCVEVNLGDSIFASGQAYTALSRVRSLEGLCITDLNFDKIMVDSEVEEFYVNLEEKLK